MSPLIPRQRRGVFAVFCTLIGYGACAQAQTVLEEVEVTARRVGGARQITEAVTSLGSEQLEAMNLQVVTDALRGAPGVFVQQTTPGQGTAIVRGLKGSEVLHIVDGMRLNNALFRNAPNQYLALVDPLIAQRVDVVRGPLSALYGSDAMGGLVQVITDRPFLGGGQWRTQGQALLRFDGRTLGQVAHASMAAGADALGFGAAVTVQDHDSLRAADRIAQVPSGFRSQAVSAFASWRPRDDQRSEFSVQFLEQPSTPRFDELVAGFGQSQAASDEFAFEPNDRFFVHAEHHVIGLADWLGELDIHAAWQRVTDGRRTRDAGAAVTRLEDNRSDLFGLTLSAAATPFGVHDVQYGIDLYHDEVSSRRDEVDVVSAERRAVRARFPDGSTIRTTDIYVHDDMTFSERLLVTAGLRLSRSAVRLAATADSAAAALDNTELTGSLGLRFQLSSNVSMTANVGRGFRAPNIFDLGTLGARPGNRFNIANPDLAPETVWTLDTGLRIERGRFELDAVAWVSDYFDQITSVSTGQTDPTGRDIVQSRNAAEVLLYGMELAARLALRRHLWATASINTVYGRTTLADGRYEPADRIPPNNARLGLRYERERWWIDGLWRVADRQDRLSARDIRDPRINPLGTPGYGVLDLRGAIELSSRWRVSGEWNNVLDKRFRAHGSGIDSAGRAIVLSVTARW